MATIEEIRAVENELRAVYNHCPPTKVAFASEQALSDFQDSWGQFFARLGVAPGAFAGRRVLDLGCGSCEKAVVYEAWGGEITGVDLTDEVIAAAEETTARRGTEIELVRSSLFDFHRPDAYDIVICDGVSFVTADTLAALRAAAANVKPGGYLVFSITNVWGRFWWFGLTRWITRSIGGADFKRRAEFGRRLFRWTRRSQEGTAETSPYFRSEDSWAYDWWGPPAYHLHAPDEVARWLVDLGFDHHGSVPSIAEKGPPRNLLARLVRLFAGRHTRLLRWYWLINAEPNMLYVAAQKARATR